MITTVLFDLDGTLLPMDYNEFTTYYFKFLCAKLAPYGFDPKELIRGIWAGTAAMVKNDGTRTNEEAFWSKFAEVLGERVNEYRAVFEEFYRVEFNNAAAVCGKNPALVDLVHALHEKNYRVALATNPLFPLFAQESRVRWAGLEPGDFELITSYESIGYTKPNPEYFREVARKLNVPCEECLMVGNNAEEDMSARDAGMQVFLLTDCLINDKNADINVYPHGDARALHKLLFA